MRRFIAIAAAALAAGAVSFAADAGPAATNAAEEVELTADRLEYDRPACVLVATGNVVVRRGMEELKADRITAKTDTLDMWATGRVTYVRQKLTWKGDSFYCNMDSGRVHANGRSEFRSKPFYVSLGGGERAGEGDRITGREALVTTCAMQPSAYHYHIRAGTVKIMPGGDVVVKNAVFYFHRVPLLYLPYWRQSVTDSDHGFDFQPGYDSRMGAFLLSSYGYDVAGGWLGRTHLDYRTKRGWAVGQEFRGKDPGKKWATELNTYYAYDELHAGPDNSETPDPIDANRYRALFKYRYAFTNQTYFISRLHYIGDYEFLDDFFRSEYRQEPQPESYAYLKHNSGTYSVGGDVRVRLNDYCDTVERLPEVFVDVSRQKVAHTFLYYDGRTAAGYLQKKVSKYSGGDEYAAGRADSHHVLSVPARVGFLSAVQRAGYRATYYTESPVDPDNPESADATGRNVVRQMYEGGLDLSFKAFKVWRQPLDGDGGLRHVVEPYANYTYISEPTVLAPDLYQFDAIDALGEKNEIRLGARNKLQIRQKGRPSDKVNVDAWTVGNLGAEEGMPRFDSVWTDTRLRVVRNLAVDVDGRYNFRGEGLKEINTHIVVGSEKKLHGDFEHRYRFDDRNLFLGDLSSNEQAPWACGYGCRVDLQDGRLEEHSLRVRRNYDCLCIVAGFSQLPGYTGSDGTKQEDDYRVSFRVWITALPNMGFLTD